MTSVGAGVSDPRLTLLLCISCGSSLALQQPEQPDLSPALGCSECGATYHMRDGVLELLPGEQYALGWSQDVYDNDWMANIYEKGTRVIGTWLLSGLTYRKEYDYLKQFLHAAYQAPILDLCCATGPHTRMLAKQHGASRLIGLDISPNMLQKGRREAESEGLGDILWIRGNALKLPFPDKSLGAINCFGAIHLFPDPLAGIIESGRVLMPGGTYTAFVAVEHPNFLMRRMQLLASPWFGVKTFSQSLLRNWLKQANMALVDYSAYGPAAMFTAVRLAC